MPTHELPLGELEPYEIGAAVLALVAHPDDKDSETRSELEAALCREAIYAHALADAGWAQKHQNIKPAYLMIDPKKGDQLLLDVNNRLRDRLQAARWFRPFLHLAEHGVAPPLPEGVKRLNKSQIIEYTSADSTVKNTDNFRKRIVEPSLPIIHLASALEFIIHHLEKIGFEKITYRHVLFHPEAPIELVRHAERIESVLPNLEGTLKIPNDLIRLRLTQKSRA